MKTNCSKVARAFASLTMAGVLGALAVQAADPPPQTQDRPGRPPGGGGGFGGLGGGARGPGGLNLDESQREALREATQKNADEMARLSEKLLAAQKELVHASLAEKQDEKVVREKAEAVSKIQVDITVLRAKSLGAIAPTLKPEQREQLENSRMGASILGLGGVGAMGAGGFGPGGPRGRGGPGGPGGPDGDQPRRRPPGE